MRNEILRERGLIEKLKWCVIKPKNSQFPSFCQLYSPHTLTYWLAQLPISHFQDSLYLMWLALPTTHIFRLFSPTWDYLPSFSQDMFSDLISLSLFLRLGIHSVSLLQCRCRCSLPARFAITSVRPRWRDPKSVWGGEFLSYCVLKRTFFFSSLVSNFPPKPGISPGMAETGLVWPVLKSVRNTTVSVPVYALVRNIPAISVGTVQNCLPWWWVVVLDS